MTSELVKLLAQIDQWHFNESLPTSKNKRKTEMIFNKKVLLRERKRHTAHRVASARYAVMVGGYLP